MGGGIKMRPVVFTNPDKIGEIRHRLLGLKVDIEDHKQSFCVLVKMERHHGDGKEEANPSTLEIDKVFKFRKLS